MIRIHNTEAVSSRKYSPGFDQHGRTLHFVFRSGSLALLLFVTSSLSQGQQTRSAEIEREREDKVLHPPPEKPDRVERTLRFIDDHHILDRLSTGFHGWNLRLGGLPQGSGFALGPEYRLQSDFLGGNTFRVGAQLSTKVYEKYYASWQLPHIARDHISVDFNAAHRNYTQVDYFGPGPDSSEDARTDYRLENTSLDTLVGLKPVKHLHLGGSAGYLWLNVGPGTSGSLPSTDQVFPPSLAPGIDRQTDFLRYGPYAQIDYLDSATAPANGGLYTFQYIWYEDQKLARNDFERMDVEVQQYFGFFNKTRVLAFRAKTTLTTAGRDQVVPFYMQPTVGGSDDLRGFRAFRFYDNNSFVLNGEYRWHAMSLLDIALFADAGKVFPRRGELNFSDLEIDGGVGFRFNIKGQPFMRVDIAASDEGVQVWFKFNQIFARQPAGTTAQPIR
jgi:outer membrane protein assembly factor BamA